MTLKHIIPGKASVLITPGKGVRDKRTLNVKKTKIDGSAGISD